MNWIQTYFSHWSGWEAIGWLGQTLFFGRFLLQWIVSEKLKRSVIPFHFWTMSIAGSALLLVYLAHGYATKHTGMPILVGQSVGMFVYVRNIMLRSREKAAA